MEIVKENENVLSIPGKMKFSFTKKTRKNEKMLKCNHFQASIIVTVAIFVVIHSPQRRSKQITLSTILK